MKSTLNPYINFSGKAREAMTYYHDIFGGELKLTSFGEMGLTDAPAEGIMHGVIEIDGAPLIMGSDGMESKEYCGFAISLSGHEADELRNYWDRLIEDGEIIEPLKAQMWGDEFGMTKDRYGVTWMVNIVSIK